MNEKPKVGDEVCVVATGNRARRGVVHWLGAVTKVGRKYFYVDFEEAYQEPLPVSIETWREKTDYSANYLIYRSLKEWADTKEGAKWIMLIRRELDRHWGRRWSVIQLREAGKALGLTLDV